jgi:hypothetical protein
MGPALLKSAGLFFLACLFAGKAPSVSSMNRLLLASIAAILMSGSVLIDSAWAQRNGNYQVMEMNFDLWCQEQAGLPAERCDKRTPEDNAAFEAYRAKVEAYEIPYLQQKYNAARMDRDILRNDPVDNPAVKDIPSQRPDLNTPSASTPPRP